MGFDVFISIISTLTVINFFCMVAINRRVRIISSILLIAYEVLKNEGVVEVVTNAKE